MKRTISGLAAILLLVGGCSSSELDAVRDLAPMPNAGFLQALVAEYQKLAINAEDNMDDTDTALYYAKKALTAAGGSDILPAEVSPEATELTTTRDRLLVALVNGGSDQFPEDSAYTQGQFDCWALTGEEEGCRETTLASLESLEAALVPVGEKLEVSLAPPPTPERPAEYTLYFDFNSVELTEASKDILQALGKDAGQDNSRVSIVGYTDASGNAAYNRKLAMARADAIKTILNELANIDAERITTSAKGADELAVETKGREAENRRAIVTLSAE